MAITNQVDKQIYTGNGVTVNFAIPHDIVSSGTDEVEVILRDETSATITETTQTVGVNYTLTGGSPPTTVTMTVAPTSTQKLLVRRKILLTQPTDYQETASFPAETHEKALDRLLAQVQVLKEILTRVPKLSNTTSNAEPVFPVTPEGDVVWGWDTDKATVRYYTIDELLENIGVGSSTTVANNQVVAANVTGMTVDGDSYTSAIFQFEVRRVTASTSKIAVGRLFLYRQPDTGTWAIETGEWYGQDGSLPGGLTFSVVQSGNDAQVKYTSDNLTGASYVGTIKFNPKFFAI